MPRTLSAGIRANSVKWIETLKQANFTGKLLKEIIQDFNENARSETNH